MRGGHAATHAVTCRRATRDPKHKGSEAEDSVSLGSLFTHSYLEGLMRAGSLGAQRLLPDSDDSLTPDLDREPGPPGPLHHA